MAVDGQLIESGRLACGGTRRLMGNIDAVETISESDIMKCQILTVLTTRTARARAPATWPVYSFRFSHKWVIIDRFIACRV
jgi:hypothetical protein